MVEAGKSAAKSFPAPAAVVVLFLAALLSAAGTALAQPEDSPSSRVQEGFLLPSADGTVRNGNVLFESLGFSVRVPQSDRWQPIPEEKYPGLPTPPVLALMTFEPQGATLVFAMEMAGLEPTTEGLDSAFGGQKIPFMGPGIETISSSDEIGEGVAQRTLAFLVDGADQRLDMRAYAVPDFLIVLAVFLPVEGAEELRQDVFQAWETARVEPPKAQAQAAWKAALEAEKKTAGSSEEASAEEPAEEDSPDP